MNVRLLFSGLVILLGVSSCGGEPAPAVHYGQTSGAGSSGIHTVSKGDTLYSISNRYRLAMRDIVVLNKIKSPFKLYVGQRMRLPPPHEYKVRKGDTLYGVSRLFGVNSSEVARLNNINSPYILKTGQVLHLPSVVGRNNAGGGVRNAKAGGDGEFVSSSLSSSSSVPVPGGKPAYKKGESIKISKVRTQAPRRSASKFLKPVNGKIISGFGAKKSGLHNDGVNIAAQRGSPVKAAENGVVVYAGNALKGSGNLILVRHENRWMSAYGHLDNIDVRKGQLVERGSVIGKVGSTGSVSTPQLHFEIRRGTSALNPVRFM